MARQNAIQDAARAWAELHNQMMCGWAFDDRSLIDHRSFAERGIPAIPSIHEGAGARALASKGLPLTRKPEWARIDEGHSRARTNELIKEINCKLEILDERTIRLGRDDEGYRKGRSSFGEALRKDRERRQSALGCSMPPFVRAQRDSAEHNDYAREDGSRPPAGAHYHRSASSCPTTIAPRSRRIRRWGSVRRFFRNLVSLHASLRARELRASGSQVTENNIQNITNTLQKPNDQRDGQAGVLRQNRESSDVIFLELAIQYM